MGVLIAVKTSLEGEAMRESLPLIIESLLNPERYPDFTKHIEVIETHASWLLLAGEFAYKIKKPITLPFLDYGTLNKRKACCEAELLLNQRFAPDLYLKVVAITGTPENPIISDQGTPIEYAVKMRRFPEAGRLDRVCARNELMPTQISALAKAIANFHNNADIASNKTCFGLPDKVMAPVLENFESLNSLLTDGECKIRLNTLLAWTHAEFKRLTPDFYSRKATGKIRECHGDLHLGNIVLINGQVTLFDCIEFNEYFRWIDVASDIAFVYVDLLDHHQPGLAGWLLNEWLNLSGDYDAIPVLRFYATYRALVRAKVAAIRAKQNQGCISEIDEYITLAEQITSSPKRKLTITHGLSGCGKTTESTRLLLNDKTGCTLRLRSDIERKRLFGLTGTTKSNSALDCGIYSQEANQRTYQHLHDLTKKLLKAGWSVIVDAAFLKHSERNAFHLLATQLDVEFGILAPQSTPEQLRARITNRLASGHDASEATIEVLEQQMTFIEPLDKTERSYT